MLEIEAIHAFSDNFIWMLKPRDGGPVTVVDPGDAAPVLARLQTLQRPLGAVLVTHKHGDHVGGIARLLQAYPNAEVYGPANEPIASLTRRLGNDERVTLPGDKQPFQVIAVPGHTEGHIAYHRPGQLFCGDTLFSVGCGRVFSGSFEQLHDALLTIAALPDDTQVYCAHEYTLDNIGFAKWVEPDNPDLIAREQACHQLLDDGKDTVPTTLAIEKSCNPFLRFRHPRVVQAVERHYGRPMADSHDCFRCLRQWKDREYD